MSGQISVASLNCLKCGATLEIGSNISQFNCGYCGAAQVVQRSGGIIALSLIDAIQQVRVGTDKTAAELAIVRLKGEVKQLEQERDELMNQHQAETVKEEKNFNLAIGVSLAGSFVALIILSSGDSKNNITINASTFPILLLVPIVVVAVVCVYFYKEKKKKVEFIEAKYRNKLREANEEIAEATRRLEAQK